jgi:WhiB family redox-sensing transcriptional regulator
MIDEGRPAWHKDAACKGASPGVSWFPEAGEDHRPALRVCEACPVNQDCLAWALEQGPQLDGIWSGTTRSQRGRLRGGRAG